MASQALYLKWRPQRFEDVVGQEHVTTTLRNALRAGRISHAYLFSGPRGTGKTTMARLLAKAVNCLEPDLAQRPCNRCTICQAVNEGRLLDLIEMDAASHTGVDNVREAIRDRVAFRPNEARYKVYVIDEVHMLSTSAFNALLKTLEEPPEHVIFCLATTEPHKVLPTILSRCQHFEFHRIPLSALVERLGYIATEEGLQVESDALQFIARMSAGCARDAISLLDQLTAYGASEVTLDRVRSVLGLSGDEVIDALLAHLASHDVGAGLDVINEVVVAGADIRQFTAQVVEQLRWLLLLRVGGEAALTDIDAPTRLRLERVIDLFSTRELLRAIKLFNQAQLDLRASDQNQLALELTFVEAALREVDSAVPAAGEGAATPVPVPSERKREVAGTPALERPPAAPPRVAADGPIAVVEEVGGPQPTDKAGADTVVLEEVEQAWTEIRRAIRAESRQVEALVNSAALRKVEHGNRVVLEFASEFLSGKLEKEENRRIVEHTLTAVLGKRCHVRGAVRGDSPEDTAAVAHEVPARTAQMSPSAASEEADPFQAAESDPLVQDLLSRGGKVTDVQQLSDE
ncbi:MAG: DNA polymerase III subunit gamma/tau [Anaerolineae bacterium]|jgi:DNA polymerase-3 subunit gamma/tau